MVTEEGLGNWNFQLGECNFENGPLLKFGGIEAVKEFRELREACIPLTDGAASIPTKALRGDKYKIIPLLPYFKALQKVIPYSDILDGSFEPFMKKYVKNEFLRSWLDALAFSLSGLPASKTGAAAMAYTIYDLHKKGTSLDYPKGGFGKIAEALTNVIINTGSHVHTRKNVQKICIDDNKVVGIQLSDKSIIKAKRGVINNANIWSLNSLLAEDSYKLNEEQRKVLLDESMKKMSTKSFMHLHLGLDITGLEKKKSLWKAHYTVMDKGLLIADPCSDRNMVAVSNPCILDNTLITDSKGSYDNSKILIHSYSAGNEDYSQWENLNQIEYELKKEKDAEFLFRSVSRALDLSIEEIKERSDLSLIG
jgi:prolycopene isomerase